MTNEGASEGSRIPSQGHCCLPEGPDGCRLGGADTRRVEERGQEPSFWQRRRPHRGALRPEQWCGDLVKLRHYPEGSSQGVSAEEHKGFGDALPDPLFFRLQGLATTCRRTGCWNSASRSHGRRRVRQRARHPPRRRAYLTGVTFADQLLKQASNTMERPPGPA